MSHHSKVNGATSNTESAVLWEGNSLEVQRDDDDDDDDCHSSSSERVINVPSSLSSRAELEEGKGAISSQDGEKEGGRERGREGGRRYCLSSRAQTC